MKLVDPFSHGPFEIAKLKMVPFAATFCAYLAKKKGRASANGMRWGQAVDAYVRALRLTPMNARLWVQLGHALGHFGMPDAAQIAYANATKAQPEDPTGHRHLGYVQRETHLHEQGMRSLARALLLDPGDRDIAEIFLTDKGEEETQEWLVNAAFAHADECRLDRPIRWQATWLRSKARKAARKRDWREAEKFYAAAIEVQPGNPDLLLQLGHAFNHQNRQPEAELAYRRAIAIEPLYVDPWLHLGYVLTAQNRHSAARTAFGTVLRLAPNRLADHPILAAAQIGHKQAISSPAEGKSRPMMCPPELGEREKAIWNLLAKHVQGKH